MFPGTRLQNRAFGRRTTDYWRPCAARVGFGTVLQYHSTSANQPALP